MDHGTIAGKDVSTQTSNDCAEDPQEVQSRPCHRRENLQGATRHCATRRKEATCGDMGRDLLGLGYQSNLGGPSHLQAGTSDRNSKSDSWPKSASNCGATRKTDSIEVHHIRALKDLNRHEGREKPLWVQIMAARKRKTLVLCQTCHMDLHAGRPLKRNKLSRSRTELPR